MYLIIRNDIHVHDNCLSINIYKRCNYCYRIITTTLWKYGWWSHGVKKKWSVKCIMKSTNFDFCIPCRNKLYLSLKHRLLYFLSYLYLYVKILHLLFLSVKYILILDWIILRIVLSYWIQSMRYKIDWSNQ